MCADFQDAAGNVTSLLDVQLHSCSNRANRVDSLALILALVMRGHSRDTQCASGQDHMASINLERTAWDFRRESLHELRLRNLELQDMNIFQLLSHYFDSLNCNFELVSRICIICSDYQ